MKMKFFLILLLFLELDISGPGAQPGLLVMQQSDPADRPALDEVGPDLVIRGGEWKISQENWTEEKWFFI